MAGNASLQSNKTLFIFQLKAFVGRSSLEAVASSNLATVTDQWILVSTAAGIHIIFRKCNFAHAHRSHSLSRALTAPAHSGQKKFSVQNPHYSKVGNSSTGGNKHTGGKFSLKE